MTVSKDMAKKLANLILRENKKGMSYRGIAGLCKMKNRDNSFILKAGTVNRFAKEKGNWIPKNKQILIALGLLSNVKTKRIADMNEKELLWRLEHRENI